MGQNTPPHSSLLTPPARGPGRALSGRHARQSIDQSIDQWISPLQLNVDRWVKQSGARALIQPPSSSSGRLAKTKKAQTHSKGVYHTRYPQPPIDHLAAARVLEANRWPLMGQHAAQWPKGSYSIESRGVGLKSQKEDWSIGSRRRGKPGGGRDRRACSRVTHPQAATSASRPAAGRTGGGGEGANGAHGPGDLWLASL